METSNWRSLGKKQKDQLKQQPSQQRAFQGEEEMSAIKEGA